jgi:hypothetical protein
MGNFTFSLNRYIWWDIKPCSVEENDRSFEEMIVIRMELIIMLIPLRRGEGEAIYNISRNILVHSYALWKIPYLKMEWNIVQFFFLIGSIFKVLLHNWIRFQKFSQNGY